MQGSHITTFAVEGNTVNLASGSSAEYEKSLDGRIVLVNAQRLTCNRVRFTASSPGGEISIDYDQCEDFFDALVRVAQTMKYLGFAG